MTGVDVALLPVSGVYVMTAGEAAEAARRIQPRVAVPMHWGEQLGSRSDALLFKERAQVEVRDPGAGPVIEQVAKRDPALATRLMVMALPAAAARIPATLAYELTVEGVGSWRVSVADGRARVDEVMAPVEADPSTDFRLHTDPESFARLANGSSPLGLMLRRRLRVRGKRRRARLLRHMNGAQPTLAEVIDAGGRVDVDAMMRALPYLVDPEWTRGHSFTVAYDIEGAGQWLIRVDDGRPVELLDGGKPDATVRLSRDTYERLAARTLAPDKAMQDHLTQVDGRIYPVTLLGRWIDRSQGLDDEELAREERQQQIQERRSRPRPVEELLDYRQLYALWERQNWKASEIDFSVDQRHWLATPAAAQENTIWSLGSFYVGEERVTADLAPFLTAAPSGEIELFLATQLVDEARHAAFFDRFGGEVMALDAEDLRGRMAEVSHPPARRLERGLRRRPARRLGPDPAPPRRPRPVRRGHHHLPPGHRGVAGGHRPEAHPRLHGRARRLPGLLRGLRPGRARRAPPRGLRGALPAGRDRAGPAPRPHRRAHRARARSARVPRLRPPYAASAREFTSYGYDSADIYGYAYRSLKRRMEVLGLQVPPAEELMPGPIADEAPALPGVSASSAMPGGQRAWLPRPARAAR